MSRKIILPPKEEIEEIYLKEGSTISSLARHYNTSNPTIRSWLKKYEIQIKTHKQASREANNRHRKEIKPSKEILEDLYNDYSQQDIGKIFNVTQSTVKSWLDEYSIEIDHSISCKKAKERQFEDIRYSKEFLNSNYDRSKPLHETADKLNISYSYLKKLLNKYDIEIQKHWRSKPEINLYEYLVNEYPHLNFRYSDRSIIHPLELDIVCEDKKIAIEYCGLYWHSENNGMKDNSYHRNKFLLCKENGYKLITVFESDDIEKIKSLFKTLFGDTKRIYARKTIIKELSSKQASDFNNKHHLHGSVGAKYHYGLFYDDKLVMSISFSKTRFNKKYEYECARMTSHSDYTVIGGASKLYKYFIDNVKPKSIITYADLRFGEGLVYLNCGFTRQKDSSPNYWYFFKYTNVLYSRIKFQKHKLKNILSSFNENLTEYENMKLNDWDRIWDCGNAVYTYEKRDPEGSL